MSGQVDKFAARVLSRTPLSDHLVRLTLDCPEFTSTGLPDEWVGLIVPGQFQSRYYTIREIIGSQLVIDVVVHAEGLVTEWASGDCVDDEVILTAPKGSFTPPARAQWIWLVADLTGFPAMARIARETTLPTTIWAEAHDGDFDGYFDGAEHVRLHRCEPPTAGSDLAATVAALDWPDTPGYFWMAGESSQMRAIRKHLMREVKLPSDAYDVMGYWRGGQARQPRAVDPGPIWRRGKAAGKSDEEIWADYDAARDASEAQQ